MWKNDDELFTIVKQELFTALLGDVLDKMGFSHQFLPPNIKPLDSKMVIIGRAMPVLEADVFEERVKGSQVSLMKKPFGLMFEALEKARGEKLVLKALQEGMSTVYAFKKFGIM